MAEKETFSLVTVNLSNYIRPELVESRSKDWVLNGKNNGFYKYIMDRNVGSATGGSLNRTYKDLIIGKGLVAKRAYKNVLDWAVVKRVLKAKDVEMIAYDFQIFGEFTFFVTKNKKGGLHSITHVQNHLVVPNKENDKGVIEGYWYCKDWTNTRTNTPVYYPTFGTSKSAIEIYRGKIYSPEQTFFGSPDYIAAMQYMEAEEEISNMNLSSIKNGLSAGYIINVPNGINWSVTKKAAFKKKIEERLTRSENASNFIISYNGVEVQITVTEFPINENIHKQWESLNSTCAQKILTGFRCPSPAIAGIISSSGFSNTADEMDIAEFQLSKRVIAPKQKVLTDAFEEVLNQFEIMLELEFVPLTEQKEDEPKTEISVKDAVKMSSDKSTPENHDHVDTDALVALGEVIDDNYTCIMSEPSDHLNLTEQMLNGFIEFAIPKPATATSESSQDTPLFKIRYKYAGAKEGEREFCQKMIKATQSGKVWKADDLDKNIMTQKGMGANGSDFYNVFKYKGGVNCQHFFERVVYLQANNDRISVNKAIKMINDLDPSERRSVMWEKNPKEVAQAAEKKNNFWRLKKKK
jgi:uncharacterized protein Usg